MGERGRVVVEGVGGAVGQPWFQMFVGWRRELGVCCSAVPGVCYTAADFGAAARDPGLVSTLHSRCRVREYVVSCSGVWVSSAVALRAFGLNWLSVWWSVWSIGRVREG